MAQERKGLDNLTVTIPTFNRAIYLNKLLNSLPKSLHVVVSDNGAFLSDEFKARFPWTKFITQEIVIDAPSNWNKCMHAVNTEWFVLPSDDDLYFEHSFNIIQHYCDQYPDADLLIFGHKVINENGVEISSWIPEKLQEFKAPGAYNLFKYGVESRFPSMLFKTAKVKECGYLDKSYKLTAGDSKLIQMILLSGTVVFIPEIVGAYRTWPQNSTTLTIGTNHWLREIDRWQNDIGGYIKNNVNDNFLEEFKSIKDEVYARNFLAGMYSLKNKKGLKKWDFIIKSRFPFKASMRTKLRILKAVLFN
jgi:glycosyltransferase involved in cell wall biosynthesis